MDKITITPLDLNSELKEICSWDEKYGKEPCFKSIRQFILEDNTYYNLSEVVDLNYERFAIGENEKKQILAFKNENKELVGFLISTIFELDKEPELFMQYLVIHPLHQHKGYGKQALTKLLSNPEKYFGAYPKEIFAFIDSSNTPCLNLSKLFGFDFTLASENGKFYRGEKIMPEKANEKE